LWSAQFTIVAVVLDCAAIRDENPEGHKQTTANVATLTRIIRLCCFMDVSLSFNDPRLGNRKHSVSGIIGALPIQKEGSEIR
jgi:hypothetical protein